MQANLNEMLSAKLSYGSERQKVLAENIASIDTPGYQAKDLVPLDFGDMLASETHKISMTVTSPMHMLGASANTMRYMSQNLHHPYEQTPTGGTVVVEEQMMKVAQNAADYQMTINLYKKIGNLNKEALGLQPSS